MTAEGCCIEATGVPGCNYIFFNAFALICLIPNSYKTREITYFCLVSDTLKEK